jgi:hypothetical protein
MQQARGTGNEEETKNAHGGGCFFGEISIFLQELFLVVMNEKTIWDFVIFFVKHF